MKTLATFFLASFLFVPLLRAQITITESDYLNQVSQAGISYIDTSYNTTDLQALVNAAGSGQNWTFGGAGWMRDTNSAAASTTTVLPYPSNAPRASDFPTATNVVKAVYSDPTQPTTYAFLRMDQTGIWFLGEAADSAGTITEPLVFTPPLQQVKFPLTYGTSWSSASTVSGSEFSSIPIPSGATLTWQSNALSDAYGTLAVPGQSADAIRVRTQQKIAMTYMGFVQTFANSYTYQWYTKTGLSATVQTDSNHNVQPRTGTYTIPAGSNALVNVPVSSDPLTLHLSENPASSESKLYYTLPADGPVQVMLMDALGRNTQMLLNARGIAGQNYIPIDAAGLASGTYFLHVNASGQEETMKLLITK